MSLNPQIPMPVPLRMAGLKLLLILLAGCTVGPAYRQPEIVTPAQWQAGEVQGEYPATALSEWWKQFNDPLLDGLIEEALAANLDLQTARAQLREARARRGMAEADKWPGMDVSAGVNHSKGSAKTGSADSRTLYNVGLDASWEADIFGGLRHARQAALADVQAQQELLRDVHISLVAEIASTYIELRSLEQRLALAKSSLATQAETVELTQWRYQAGMVSELDTLLARTQLEQTRAGLPVLNTAIVAASHRLAVLLGRQPGESGPALHSTDTAIPAVNTAMAIGIPADVLRQRPDVRAAERRLAAQTARLGEAEAARYPSLRLSGSLGLQALDGQGLASRDALSRSLLAGISAPVFDAGRIRSQIAAQDALLEQARLAYQAAVLAALEEVENALVTLAGHHQRQQELTRAVTSARSGWQLTLQSYQAGLSDFQSVLDSQRTLLALEELLASNGGELGQTQVRLFKALGGGWQQAEQPGQYPTQSAPPPTDHATAQETL